MNFRCRICGRLLAGMREDHEIQCRIARAMSRGGFVPDLVPPLRVVSKRRIVEGSEFDPFRDPPTKPDRPATVARVA